MKILLKLFISITAALVMAVLIIAAIAPSSFSLERSIEINKPLNTVFGYIKLLKNQSNYSVWAGMDPAMKKTFKGTDGEAGFVSAWESNNKQVGKGEQEIILLVEGQRIETQLRFLEPFESKNSAYMATEAISSVKTKVSWGFTGHMPYPFNIFLLFTDMEGEVGNNLQQGLENLKGILEQESR